MARKKETTQKQRQKQSVKQTVIVRIGESSKRKRSYRKRKPRGESAGEPYIRPLPSSNVIFQSTQIIPVPYQKSPEQKLTDPEKKPKTLLEDVGVGTEGFVKILELPSKSETIERMTTPVSKEVEMEKSERKQMEREDIASFELGLSKFNTEPKPRITQQISKPQIQLEGSPMGMSQMDTGRVQDAIESQSEKMAQFKPSSESILSSMYERYGSKIESEAKKREDSRQERNRKQRERYARKKANIQK
jgi:hypothetical protein